MPQPFAVSARAAAEGMAAIARAGLISPSRIAREFETQMREFERAMQHVGVFAENLVVTQSAYDPRRLDVSVQLQVAGMMPHAQKVDFTYSLFDDPKRPEYPTLWDHLLAAE